MSTFEGYTAACGGDGTTSHEQLFRSGMHGLCGVCWCPCHTLTGIFDQVWAERCRQERLWGRQDHPDGTGPTMTTLNRREEAQRACQHAAAVGTLTFRHILTEEFREALAESDPLLLRNELVQLAAVAVQWIDVIDRRAAG